MRSFQFILVLFYLLFCHASSSFGKDEKDLWKLLNDKNYFVMIRHALAPGTGDPGHFKIRDCKTQRNLSYAGRVQSKKIGELFRENGITKATIYSSQWCRCLETARLMDLGKVNELSYLNSFYEKWHKEEVEIPALRKWLGEKRKAEGPLILVTHFVTINSLIGADPGSGEIVFVKKVKNKNFKKVGEIQTLPN